MKNYSYYYEAYDAILHEFIGEYEVELPDDSGTENKIYTKKYGVKAFLPIAKKITALIIMTILEMLVHMVLKEFILEMI